MKFSKPVFSSVFFFFILIINAQAGIYFEYKMTMGQKHSGVIKTWFQNGNSRNEVVIPGLPGGMGNMVAITRNEQPDKVFLLNEGTHTYMELAGSDSDNSDDDGEVVDITVMGQEKVNGYNSTHVLVKKKGMKNPEHFWLSKDIKGYRELNRIKGKYQTSEDLLKKFEAKGVEGFPVKMTMQSEEGEVKMELVKADELNIPDSKFSLSGYEKAPSMPMGPGGIDVEKIKNMTPAERQKMVEEMMKQYGK